MVSIIGSLLSTFKASATRSFSLSRNKKLNWKPSNGRSQENEIYKRRIYKQFVQVSGLCGPVSELFAEMFHADVSGLLPYSFNNMFLVTRQVHSYGTRSSEHFYLPQCRTNIRKFSISFQGPKFFNSLSFEIRNATRTASFCCKLKAFLLS